MAHMQSHTCKEGLSAQCRRDNSPGEGHRAWPAHTPTPGHVSKQQGPHPPHLPDPPEASDDGKAGALCLAGGRRSEHPRAQVAWPALTLHPDCLGGCRLFAHWPLASNKQGHLGTQRELGVGPSELCLSLPENLLLQDLLPRPVQEVGSVLCGNGVR